jgi:hypothetical protein
VDTNHIRIDELCLLIRVKDLREKEWEFGR